MLYFGEQKATSELLLAINRLRQDQTVAYWQITTTRKLMNQSIWRKNKQNNKQNRTFFLT